MKSYRIRGIDHNGKRWYYHAIGNYWDRVPLGAEFKFKGDAVQTLYDADRAEPDFLIDVEIVSVDSGYVIAVNNSEDEHVYLRRTKRDLYPLSIGFEWVAERKDATWFDSRREAQDVLKQVRLRCIVHPRLVRVGC